MAFPLQQICRQSSELIQRLNKIEAALRAHSEFDSPGLQRSILETPKNRRDCETNDWSPSRDGSQPSTVAFAPHSHATTKRNYSRYQEDNTDGLAAVTVFSDDDDEPDDGEGPYYGA